ncbi:MAG: hypothetical protein QM500_13540 [Methylococcales bacterium]
MSNESIWLREYKKLNIFFSFTLLMTSSLMMFVISGPILDGDNIIKLDGESVAHIMLIWCSLVILIIFSLRLFLSQIDPERYKAQEVGNLIFRLILLAAIYLTISSSLDKMILFFQHSPGMIFPIIFSTFIIYTSIDSFENSLSMRNIKPNNRQVNEDITIPQNFNIDNLRDVKRSIENAFEGCSLMENKIKNILLLKSKNGFLFDEKIAMELATYNIGNSKSQLNIEVICRKNKNGVKATIYDNNENVLIELASGFGHSKALAIISAFIQRQIVLINNQKNQDVKYV